MNGLDTIDAFTSIALCVFIGCLIVLMIAGVLYAIWEILDETGIFDIYKNRHEQIELSHENKKLRAEGEKLLSIVNQQTEEIKSLYNELAKYKYERKLNKDDSDFVVYNDFSNSNNR